MFIQTEQTPNPLTVKFLPGVEVMKTGTIDFRNKDEADCSPLASRLFQLESVEGVFLSSDFVSITKSEEASWQELKPIVLGIIMEHFVSQQPVIHDNIVVNDPKQDTKYDDSDAEVVGQIRELLDVRVRPAVAQDGGDIEFRGFKEGVVFLQLQGSCQGCPSATMTLKMGIENMLKHYIPEVVEVRAVN